MRSARPPIENHTWLGFNSRIKQNQLKPPKSRVPIHLVGFVCLSCGDPESGVVSIHHEEREIRLSVKAATTFEHDRTPWRPCCFTTYYTTLDRSSFGLLQLVNSLSSFSVSSQVLDDSTVLHAVLPSSSVSFEGPACVPSGSSGFMTLHGRWKGRDERDDRKSTKDVPYFFPLVLCLEKRSGVQVARVEKLACYPLDSKRLGTIMV